MSVKSLDELIINRKELLEVHKKNNFTDGINSLLTDLYPDTAHFIYELLQNAEDMLATSVKFMLYNDKIEFEHNGTKRDFTLDDINAITSIGNNSQKKNDPTSIGKFGVGFKAVFAYTKTPEIHSGIYHFCITDYFLPVITNIRKIEKPGWTTFIFPFDNPKKPPRKAVMEIERSLKSINATSLLFLRNISSIEYIMPDGKSGHVMREEFKENYVRITNTPHNNSKIYETTWLRFQKEIELKDEYKKNKRLNIAIAYSLECDDKTKELYRIVPIEGQTFIYFPAEKEHSKLNFHINGPFASTVARDSVRECPENGLLINKVADLVVESLNFIKQNGLLNVSFLSVMPNMDDLLSDFYRIIYVKVCTAFMEKELVPTRDRKYNKSVKLISGPANISLVLGDSELMSIYKSKNMIWAANAALRNQREDKFLSSLDIREYNYHQVAEIFDDSYRSEVESIIENKDDEWVKSLYSLLNTTYENLNDDDSDIFLKNIRQTKLVRVKNSKERHTIPKLAYFLETNSKLFSSNVPIVDTAVYQSQKGSYRVKDSVNAKQFLEKAGVTIYGPQIEIEKNLKKYINAFIPDEDYFRSIVEFAVYSRESSGFDFSKYSFLLYSKAGKLMNATPKQLIFGAPYIQEGYNELAKVYDRQILWDGYSKTLDAKDLELFVEFVRKLGVFGELKIEKIDVTNHPEFYTYLFSEGRNTGNGENVDYTINRIEKLVKLKSISVSKMIWDTITKYKPIFNYSVLHAKYSPNGTANAKKCDSTLVYYLKNFEWIPDNTGKFRKPSDMNKAILRSDFQIVMDNGILDAIGFNSIMENNSDKILRLRKEVEKAGLRIISQQEFDLLETLKKKQLDRQKNQSDKSPIPIDDLLVKQNKINTNRENQLDEHLGSGSVQNIERREKNIELTFKESAQTHIKARYRFQKVAESTKEEKNMLANEYNGKCQICGTVIQSYDNKKIFHARNIIHTNELPPNLIATIKLGWNSLCLCPNCSTRYINCSKNLTGFVEQVESKRVIPGDNQAIEIVIEINNTQQKIRYTPKHFLALKKAFEILK